MSSSAKTAFCEAMELVSNDPHQFFSSFLSQNSTASCSSGPMSFSYWQGFERFKSDLLRHARSTRNDGVLIASSSGSLMDIAARALFFTCRKVLTTDLIWPPYLHILNRERIRTSNKIVRLSLRRRIARHRESWNQILERIVATYRARSCDGLFLSSVSADGIRLPIDQIVNAVKSKTEPRLIVVDGAQEFSHCGGRSAADCCDLYLTGCHKWLGAYLPLALAMYCKRRSAKFLETTIDRMICRGEIQDPLLKLAHTIDCEMPNRVNESINLTPLMAASGALHDATKAQCRFGQRLHNAQLVESLAPETGWVPKRPRLEFHSGIIMLQSKFDHVRKRDPSSLRSVLQSHGVAVSAYNQGKIRLSMPAKSFQQSELDQLANALTATSKRILA